MGTAAAEAIGEVEVYRQLARVVHRVVKLNLDGLVHQDSLIHPQPGGNCLNWVLGHLVCVYNEVLPMLGQPALMESSLLKPYARGSAPLSDSNGLPLSELVSAWDEAAKRVDEGLAGLSVEKLDERAPFSPRNNPEETVGSLLGLICFHQSYHAGQTGLLRRMGGQSRGDRI